MGDEGAVSCGVEITLSTPCSTLTKPAPKAGAGEGVVLGLGCQTASGAPGAVTQGPGIMLRNVSGGTVRNGTVTKFHAGVAIRGGAGNVVQELTSEDNLRTPGSVFGDGIVVNDSPDNTLRGNVLRRNGPFSSISLGPRATANEVPSNTVADSSMSHVRFPEAGRQTMGIPEGPAASHNGIVDNTVTGCGCGCGCGCIVVLAECHNPDHNSPCVGTPPNEHKLIAGNTANIDGTSGRGCGVRLFSMPLPMPSAHTVVRDNVADGNTSYGIAPDGLPLKAAGNRAVGHRAHGNGEFDGSDGTLMPPCSRSVWRTTISVPSTALRLPAQRRDLRRRERRWRTRRKAVHRDRLLRGGARKRRTRPGLVGEGQGLPAEAAEVRLHRAPPGGVGQPRVPLGERELLGERRRVPLSHPEPELSRRIRAAAPLPDPRLGLRDREDLR